ncbi:TOG array regulator of axonemal microtubules protein 2-like [Genypterus blacodes]|uniref:TOG array regulator of axonemal microtubules protein 2-like n=1 Tax=Genypterus blacodes TaxID=154954 RepID=UPI003F766ABC
MKTLRDLYVHLGKAMDPEAECTGSALLLHLGQNRTKTETLQANLALDALTNHCSPGPVLSALLNTGLNHSSALVRGSTGQHLCRLVGILGGDQVLSSAKFFRSQIIRAACAMALDGAIEVRKYGCEMLRILSLNNSFPKQLRNIVPNKDWNRLQNVLQEL